MATALKLKNDIKKLKSAINSKATPKSFLPKLKAQLEKAENELASLKSGAKPRKTSTTKGTEKTLSALEKLIQKKKYSVYKGAGVDLKKDAGEGALATGRRVSKGLKANQYGSKGDNKGNVYYEYRPNRLDVKQPKKAQKYPKLEKGGETSSKVFNTKLNVGKAKYVVSYHDGKKTNKDGSPFYDMAIFKNMKDFMNFKKKLKPEGYKEYADGGMMDMLKEDDYVWNAAGKKLVVEKVTDAEYYLSGFMQPFGMPFSKDKVHEYIKSGLWSLKPKYADGGKMSHGGETEDLQHLVGSSINVYQMGVKQPTVETIKSIRVTDKKFSNRDVVLETEGGGVDRFPLSKLDDFLKGEDIKITGGKEPYAIALVEKMAKGGEVKVDDILEASTGVRVKVVDYDPKFGGRVKVRRMDEYDTGEPSQWIPVSKFKRVEGKMMAKGGAVSHGLKMGDKIVADQFWENSVVVDNPKTGRAVVYLETGKRVESGKMAYGGELHKTEA